MSLTPIWDATLADAPRNIWEASAIFLRPTVIAEKAICDAEWTYITVPPLQPTFTDWTAITDPRHYAKVTGVFP